jgi:hypothetical protein
VRAVALSAARYHKPGAPPPPDEPPELEPDELLELELEEDELELELLDELEDELLELDDEELDDEELLEELPVYSLAPISYAVPVGLGSPSMTVVKPLIEVPASTAATEEARWRFPMVTSVNQVLSAVV